MYNKYDENNLPLGIISLSVLVVFDVVTVDVDVDTTVVKFPVVGPFVNSGDVVDIDETDFCSVLVTVG